MRTAVAARTQFLTVKLTIGVAACALASPVLAQAEPADVADVAYFIGNWAVSPAPTADFEDILSDNSGCQRPVTIAPAAEGQITRTSPEQPTPPPFRVMTIAGNFPWWPAVGGIGPVARKVDEGTFDLAPNVMGRADWHRALRHKRCPHDQSIAK